MKTIPSIKKQQTPPFTPRFARLIVELRRMNTTKPFRHFVIGLFICTLSTIANAQLITNGDFGLTTVGTTANFTTSGGVDSTTFADWRFFSVGSPAINTFIGTVVTADQYGAGGSASTHALRLDVDNTGSPAGNDYAIDRDYTKLPVSFGTNYTISYDAVLYGLTGGSFAFTVAVSEFDVNGSFLGAQTNFIPTLGATFQTFSDAWTPTNVATTQINLAFHPVTQQGFLSAVGLTNVAVVPEPGTVSLLVVAAAGMLGGVCFRKRRKV